MGCLAYLLQTEAEDMQCVSTGFIFPLKKKATLMNFVGVHVQTEHYLKLDFLSLAAVAKGSDIIDRKPLICSR